MVRRVRTWGLWLLLAGLAAATAMGQDAGERVSRQGPVHDDYYAAGGSVTVQGKLEGDAVLAGGMVDLDGDVSGIVLAAGGEVRLRGQMKGDVMSAGGKVDLRGSLADDARLVGGEVTVHARIAGDLIAAGGLVILEPGGRVDGRAALAGSNVEVRGTVEHRLMAGGGTILIDGVVNGDVDAEVGQLTLGPSARIAGSLTYRSAEPAKIDPQAKVGGTIQHVVSPVSKHWVRTWVVAKLVSALMMAAAVFTLGAAWLGLFPSFTRAASASLRECPGRSSLIGLALVFGVPMACVALSATGLGFPLAVFLGLSYVPGLLLGIATAAFALGDSGLQLAGREDGTGSRFLALLGAALLLAGVSLIPFLGIAAVIVATTMGSGAFWLALSRADARRLRRV